MTNSQGRYKSSTAAQLLFYPQHTIIHLLFVIYFLKSSSIFFRYFFLSSNHPSICLQVRSQPLISRGRCSCALRSFLSSCILPAPERWVARARDGGSKSAARLTAAREEGAGARTGEQSRGPQAARLQQGTCQSTARRQETKTNSSSSIPTAARRGKTLSTFALTGEICGLF